MCFELENVAIKRALPLDTANVVTYLSAASRRAAAGHVIARVCLCVSPCVINFCKQDISKN